MAEATSNPWPALDYTQDRATFETLHLMSQIVGKARTACAPWVNHGWQVALYVSPRGLTTSPVPNGGGLFDLEFDFVEHLLRCRASNGFLGEIPLAGQSVAHVYRAVEEMLSRTGAPVRINGVPNEIPDPVPFLQDAAIRVYDPDAAWRLWQALIQIERVFQSFRTGYLGKVSPVHLFWGSFDLAVTRFSGRTAPPHPGGIPHLPDAVTREAYSHEVSSAGFWPGGGLVEFPAFYAYAYPEPRGSGRPRCGRPRPRSTKAWASSSCPTMQCVRPPIPTQFWANSWSRPTRRRRTPAAGREPSWNARSARRACRVPASCGRP